jgi:short-subunit dehydrogenase
MTKTVLITGASSGLGLSHAIYLSNKGYNVIGTTRDLSKINSESLEQIYRKDHRKYKIKDEENLTVTSTGSYIPKSIDDNLQTLIDSIRYMELDLSNPEQIEQVVSDIWENETVDVLVNNAGIGYFGPSEYISEKQMLNQFEANYFGHVRMVNAILPKMRQNGKSQIINTSSLGGFIGIPYQAHYSASKAAILKYTESLRVELRNQPISISSIDPGDINTNFNAQTAKLLQHNDQLSSTELRQIYDSLDQEYELYEPDVSDVWLAIVKNLIVSPPPLVVSKTIHKIIRAKNPKVHYQCGNIVQKVGVPLLVRLFPQNLVPKIIAMFYGL